MVTPHVWKSPVLSWASVNAEVTVRLTGTVRGLFVAPADVTVIIALCVPAATPEAMTLTAIVDGAVPLGGVRMSHGASSVAVQFSVPPPALPTISAWLGGSAPPCTAEKEKLVADRVIVGGGAEIVSVTVAVLGLLEAPTAVMTIAPVYVPAIIPTVDTETVTVVGAVPVVGLSVSHEASSEAVHVIVPPPVLPTMSVWLAGLAPPCAPENVSADGPIDSDALGGAGPSPPPQANVLRTSNEGTRSR